MTKESIAKRKKEILASIADPQVREHYRVQLDEAERLESEEGVVTAFHEVFEGSSAHQFQAPDGVPVDVFGSPSVLIPRKDPVVEQAPRQRRTFLAGVVLGIVTLLLLHWLLGK